MKESKKVLDVKQKETKINTTSFIYHQKKNYNNNNQGSVLCVYITGVYEAVWCGLRLLKAQHV